MSAPSFITAPGWYLLSVTSAGSWNTVVSSQWNLSGSTFGDTIYRMKGPGSGGSGGEYVVNGTVLTEANNWESISISGNPTLDANAAYFVFIRSIGQDITIGTSDPRQVSRNYPGYTWSQKTAPSIGNLSVPAAGGGAIGSFSYLAPDASTETQIDSFNVQDATGAVVSIPVTVGVAGSGVTASKNAGGNSGGYTTGTGGEHTLYSNLTWTLTSGPTYNNITPDPSDITNNGPWTYTFSTVDLQSSDSFTLTDQYGGTITYTMINDTAYTLTRDAKATIGEGYTTGYGPEDDNVTYNTYTWSLTSGPSPDYSPANNLVSNGDNTWTYTFSGDMTSQPSATFTLTDITTNTSITYNVNNTSV